MNESMDQLPQDSERVESGTSVLEQQPETPAVVWEGDVVIEVGEV